MITVISLITYSTNSRVITFDFIIITFINILLMIKTRKENGKALLTGKRHKSMQIAIEVKSIEDPATEK